VQQQQRLAYLLGVVDRGEDLRDVLLHALALEEVTLQHCGSSTPPHTTTTATTATTATTTHTTAAHAESARPVRGWCA
jgi:hypothetical protein